MGSRNKLPEDAEVWERHGVLGEKLILLNKWALHKFVLVHETLSSLKRKELKGIERILVVQLYGIGDYLMSTPAIRALKELFPKARVSVVGRGKAREFAERNPFVDEFIPYRGLNKKFLKELKGKRFDLGVSLNNSVEGALLNIFSGAGLRLGYLYDNKVRGNGFRAKGLSFNRKTHWREMYALVPKAIGGKVEKEKLVLEVKRGDEAAVEKLLKEKGLSEKDLLVGVNNNTRIGAEAKQWSNKRMAEVVDWLAEEFNARMVFVGSKGDGKNVREIIQMVKHKEKCFDLSGEYFLGVLPALVKKMKLLLSVDNAVMHVGSAVGTKTVALFGPTDADILFSFSPNDSLIRAGVPCSPCYWRGPFTKCRKGECMDSISVQEVKRVVGKRLRGRAVSADF